MLTSDKIHKHGAILPEGYECDVLKIMRNGRVHIKNEDTSDGSAPIKLWTPEEHYSDLMNMVFGMRWSRTIVMKSRRAYMTTHMCIGVLIEMLMTPYFKGFLINWQKNLGSSEMMKNMLSVIIENTEMFQNFKATNEKVYYEVEGERGGRVFNNVSSARSSGGDFGLFTDFAKFSVERPDEADEALSGTGEAINRNRMVIESTSAGASGRFAEIAQGAYERQKEIAKNHANGKKSALDPSEELLFFFPWYVKKTNTQPILPGRDIDTEVMEYFEKLEKEEDVNLTDDQKWWYFTKWKGSSINRSWQAMAEEHPSTFEEAFNVDTSKRILAEEIIYLRDMGRLGERPHQGGMVNISMDIGFNDKTALLFWEEQGGSWVLIDSYAERNKTTEHYIEQIRKRGYHINTIILPHDGAHDNAVTAQKMHPEYPEASMKKRFHMAGFNNIAVVERLTNQEACFQASKRFMRKISVNVPNCKEALARLKDASREEAKTSNGGLVTLSKLRHTDDSADWYKAFETGARFFEAQEGAVSFDRREFEAALRGEEFFVGSDERAIF